MNINDYISKIKKETSDIEFAYGTSLDDKNNIDDLLFAIERVTRTIKDFSDLVSSSYDEIKNNEELKKTIFELKNNTNKTLQKAQDKIQEYYLSEKVQKIVKGINAVGNLPEINEPIEKIKNVTIEATIKTCESIERLINKEK